MSGIVREARVLTFKSIRETNRFLCLYLSKKRSLFVLLSLFCVACSNSKLVLRPLYNSLDNKIEDQFLAYTKYDQEQTQQIKDLIDHFHVWHRKSQLQHYSSLLDEITGHLKDTETVSGDDITRWSESINTYRSNLITCNPFYASTDIIVSLNDEQISDIRDTRQARREARKKRRAEEDENEGEEILAESNNGRIKQVKRFLRFINITLNKEQLDDLSSTMSKTMRPKTSFGPIRDKLDTDFYTLLDKRKTEGFDSLLADFLDNRQQIISDWRATSRDHNRALWEAYALRTIHSLDNAQRGAASNYLNGLKSTINALAADAPSYQKKTASEYACLGKKISL